MLTDVLTLNDGVADQTFTLISREGMSSERRNTTSGVASSNNAALVIKHTIDKKSKTKPNRHLVLVTFTEIDVNGAEQQSQAHLVITRAKSATDAQVTKNVAVIADFLSTPANVAAMLIGGN